MLHYARVAKECCYGSTKMRTAIHSALCVLIVGCFDRGFDDGGPAGPIDIDDFCEEMNKAGCDGVFGQRCSAMPVEREACLASLEDTWDGCPLVQQAVVLGEASYDPEAARTLVERTRAAPCGEYPVPDWVNEVMVFTPKLAEGQRCHSNVSCIGGLRCDDPSVSMPEGTCVVAEGVYVCIDRSVSQECIDFAHAYCGSRCAAGASSDFDACVGVQCGLLGDGSLPLTPTECLQFVAGIDLPPGADGSVQCP